MRKVMISFDNLEDKLGLFFDSDLTLLKEKDFHDLLKKADMLVSTVCPTLKLEKTKENTLAVSDAQVLDRFTKLVWICDALYDLYAGDKEKVLNWLTQKNPQFFGAIPLYLILGGRQDFVIHQLHEYML